jgi:hypothetical protein
MQQDRSPVTFDEGSWSQTATQKAKAPFMVRMLVTHSGGMVRDAKHAHQILVWFSVGVLCVSAFIWYTASRNTEQENARVLVEQAIEAEQAIE